MNAGKKTLFLAVLILSTVQAFGDEAETPTATADKRKKSLDEANSLRFRPGEWDVYEDDVFVAYCDGTAVIRKRLAGKVADYCSNVAGKVGYEEFRLYAGPGDDWDKKFRFYGYKTVGSWNKLLDSMGLGRWAAAFAAGKRRVFFYYLNLDPDLIFHELSHEIYNEFIKNADVPLWWHEGIAQYTNLTKNEARKSITKVRFAVRQGKHVRLQDMTSYGAARDEVTLFYDEALSAVWFLIKSKSEEDFFKLNNMLRDGLDFEHALKYAYGFDSIDKMNGAWEEYMKGIKDKDIE